MSVLTRVRAMFCRHTTVKIMRWNRNVLRPEQQGKEHWIDTYQCANLVQCVCCGTYLKPAPRTEKLYGEEK